MAKQVTATGPVEGSWALPSGWRWEALGSLGTWSGGGTPSKARPDFWIDGTVPWVSPKDMKRPLIDSSEDAITVAAVNGSSAKMISAGSVLCVMRSGILRHTFPVAVNTIDVTLNQDMRALTPRSDIDPRYLAYYLRFTGNTVLHTASKAGTTVNSIEASRLDRHAVPVVDFDRQRTIVARIDELFAEIDEGEAALARARDDLATWRKALLKAAVTGELTADWRAANSPSETGFKLVDKVLADRRARWNAEPKNKGKRYKEPTTPDGGTLPGLPADWCWATMDQLSWSSGYGTSERCSIEHTGTPVLRIPNVRWGTISLDNLKYTAAPIALDEGRELSIGDLLIVRTNGSDDLIGRAALVLTPPPETTYFASYLIRLRLLGSMELLQWVALLIDSPVFRASVLRSIASSAGQYNLSLSKIDTFAVPIPPIDEVGAVISRLQSAQADAADGERALHDASATAATLRQSILAAAFRGELA